MFKSKLAMFRGKLPGKSNRVMPGPGGVRGHLQNEVTIKQQLEEEKELVG